MYAITKTGGKQYVARPGNVLKIEKLEGEPGTTIELNEVLLVHDGKESITDTKTLQGYCVVGEVLEQCKADKIIVFKKKRRQNYRRKNGHRQQITVLRVKDITVGGKSIK